MTSNETDTVMTPEEYRALRVKYGADTGFWPDAEQASAKAFVKTQAGQRVCAEESGLDALLNDLQAEERSSVGDPSDFLARLSVIPANHSQSIELIDQQDATVGYAFAQLFDRVFSPKALFSPAGFASQGALCAVLLFGGVVVGMNTPANNTYDADYDLENNGYDLTESLFGGAVDVYSLEE